MITKSGAIMRMTSSDPFFSQITDFALSWMASSGSIFSGAGAARVARIMDETNKFGLARKTEFWLPAEDF
jgi:hypothetical protein